MTDKKEPHNTQSKTWLDKLSQKLLGEPKNKDDLLGILRDSEERELIDSDTLKMIEGVLQVSQMKVRDIMIPRPQMIVVEKDDTPEVFLPKIIDSAHSRFPVIGDDRDEVIGILLAKDCLMAAFKQDESFKIDQMLRPPVFVPESKRLDAMLKEFRSNRNHMAIVIDEYGGVAGLITIEDVLEQIVGDIADEHDPYHHKVFIKKQNDNNFTVNALTPIEEFNEYFSAKLEDDEFDTIGGIVMHALGHLPARGEQVTIGQHRFKVLHADNRRIRLLRATIIDEDEGDVV